MEPTDDELKRSGAVRAVCMIMHRGWLAGVLGDWIDDAVTREFRQYNAATIARLIDLAIEAKYRALECMASEIQPPELAGQNHKPIVR